MRIFKIDRILRFAIYFGIIFQALYYTAVTCVAIGAIVKCDDISANSNRFCINYGKPVVAMNAAVNAATDIYVLLLPLGRVWKLQLSFKRRLGILALFSAGIVFVLLLQPLVLTLTSV